MTIDKDNKSWWATLPGIITSIATLVTAVGGLLVILNVNGYLSRPQDKVKEDIFEKVEPGENEEISVSANTGFKKSGFKKQLFKGNVGKLEADFELTFDVINKKVQGNYNYLKRPGITYDLIGTITNKGIELTELTGNRVTATCFLELTNDDCYTGQMNNANGKLFEMNLCKVVQ